jgi:FtsH-binding integral membrane protein
VGLTAYDVQSLTRMAQNVSTEDDTHRFAIIGALKLYLDFINLFLFLLRFLGTGRRD